MSNITDHARGCQGREYTCTCGYDDQQADEIERLRAALGGMVRFFGKYPYYKPNPDYMDEVTAAIGAAIAALRGQG